MFLIYNIVSFFVYIVTKQKFFLSLGFLSLGGGEA